MFNALSTIETMFYTLLAVGFLAFMIWLCVKFKAARLAVGVIALISLYVGGTVSGLYVNSYYTASGGIIGKLESIILPNKAETTITVTDLQIRVDDVALIKQADETYLASIKISDTFKFDSTKDYSLSINGQNSDLIEYSTSYLKGSFTQLFYIDYAMTKSVIKTFNYSMFLYEEHVEFDIYVDNDIDAVSLWNSYFDKNGCNINIKTYNSLNKEFFTIDFYFKDTLYHSAKIKAGSGYVLPPYVWRTTNGVLVEKIENIQADIILYFSADLSSLSDEDLRIYVAEKLGLVKIPTGSGESTLNTYSSNEEMVRGIYEYITGYLPTDDLTCYEICDLILSQVSAVFEIFIEYDESITYRQCLELIFISFSEMEMQ